MDHHNKTIGTTSTDFFTHGENPTLLILSGVHGDEYEVISSVQKALEKYENQLPSFLYIPEVSPSAIAAKTQENKDGKDLNRNFFDDSPIDEIQNVMQLVKRFRFDTCIDFHEDGSFSDFYLYDCYGPLLEGTSQLTKLQNDIRDLGVGLLNGTDDPNDPDLGYIFIDGYNYSSFSRELISKGFFSSWAFSRGYIKRFLNPEIPGKLPPETKDKLVDLIFYHLLLEK